MSAQALHKLIAELSETYEAKDIQAAAVVLEDTPPVSVGFLGEFNSGKSTLINALLGRKLLPAMERPTSRSIIYVQPDPNTSDVSFFRQEYDGAQAPISATEFADIALGRASGEGIAIVPSRDLLLPGIRLVDTPGIESLNDTDADITFGCLPFLDGAVICHDINKGNFTDSVLRFLQRSEFIPMLDRVLIVLTRADSKPSDEAREKVRQHVVSTLQKELPTLSDPASRVVVTSGKCILEDAGGPWLDPFESAYRKEILGRHQAMATQRQTLLIRQLASQLSEFLALESSAIEMEDGDLREKERQLDADVDAIQEKRRTERKHLDEMREKLDTKLTEVCEGYVSVFQSAQDPDAIARAAQDFTRELTECVERSVGRYCADFKTPSVHFAAAKIEYMLKTTLKSIEFAKQISTMALTACLLGGTSVAANAAEAAAGGAARGAGKAAKTAAKVAQQVSRSQKVLQFIGTLIKDMNPLEYVGDMVGELAKSAQLKARLPRIADEVSAKVCAHLADTVEFELLEPLERELKQGQAAMEAAAKQRRKSEAERMQLIVNMKRDGERLKAAIQP